MSLLLSGKLIASNDIKTIRKSNTPQKFLRYEVGPLIISPFAKIFKNTSIQKIIVIVLSILSIIIYFLDVVASKGFSIANKIHDNNIKNKIKNSNTFDSIMQFNLILNLFLKVNINNDFPSID